MKALHFPYDIESGDQRRGHNVNIRTCAGGPWQGRPEAVLHPLLQIPALRPPGMSAVQVMTQRLCLPVKLWTAKAGVLQQPAKSAAHRWLAPEEPKPSKHLHLNVRVHMCMYRYIYIYIIVYLYSYIHIYMF